MFNELSQTLRMLCIDTVVNANSGHLGMPLGMADVATTLFKDFLVFNPQDPTFIGRDKFVLSCGHGSAMLYSILYLTGYKGWSIDDLKQFRKYLEENGLHYNRVKEEDMQNYIKGLQEQGKKASS